MARASWTHFFLPIVPVDPAGLPERVIEYLRRDPLEPDESLKTAAALGMAGGALQL